MKHFGEFQFGLSDKLGIYRLLRSIFFLFTLSISITSIAAQDPGQAIRDLKEGTLIVRFPAFKSKIDTLQSMITRADSQSKNRLTHLLNEALYERDSVRMDYMSAFKNYYDFSEVAYFFDNESKNMQSANFYNMDGEKISNQEINKLPVFYMVFERTNESKVDAIVIYDSNMKHIPRPFPNNFTRGGFGFLFVKASEKSFPEWRIKKINKKLHKFWSQVN